MRLNNRFRRHCERARIRLVFPLLVISLSSCLMACASSPRQSVQPVQPSPKEDTTINLKSRAETIPTGAVKMLPSMDGLPPKLNSDKFYDPVPLRDGVDTAGGEDSAFVLPNGNTLYFFFTPDVNIPPEKQLIDGVTGIYISQKTGNDWEPARRVILQNRNEVALDGCACVQGNEMWFGSARKGNFRGVDIWTAQNINGKWSNWQNAGKKLNSDYEVGEMHITADGEELYFHSPRAGGQGSYDIWVTRKVRGEWQMPINIEAVNSPDMNGWPFITQDGNELWFTRFYMGSPAIFCSSKIDGLWGKPELVISQFAGEPTLDNDGNLYFTHHFFKDGKMIEADIYVAYRK